MSIVRKSFLGGPAVVAALSLTHCVEAAYAPGCTAPLQVIATNDIYVGGNDGKLHQLSLRREDAVVGDLR